VISVNSSSDLAITCPQANFDSQVEHSSDVKNTIPKTWNWRGRQGFQSAVLYTLQLHWM